MKWINHISRQISLATIHYPHYAHTTASKLFPLQGKPMFYYSREGWVKGYKSKESSQAINHHIRKHLREGRLGPILATFKRLIKQRDRHVAAFTSRNLDELPQETILEAMQTFDKLYKTYWSYHVFAFNLDKAVHEQPEQAHLHHHESTLKEVRNVNPFLMVEEQWYPHLFAYLSKKTGITQSLLYACRPEELQALLKGTTPLTKATLKKRNQCYLLITQKGEETLYQGDEAEKKYRALCPPETHAKNKTLRGTVAWHGNVTGKVCVVRSKKDFAKIKPDCILVAPQTTPEYAPFLHQVKAIVTDEGGRLCHAAIISREQKKPCLIGTQHATQQFKDGDVVDMDTKKGIVKKVKA